jgi:hypothetical protein
MAMQLRSGYRPLTHPPARVPYSWDMFAIRIERCVVSWYPPLQIDGRPVARWHDRMPPIEFDHVFNEALTYEVASQAACKYRTDASTVAAITCFRGDGGIDERRIPCR